MSFPKGTVILMPTDGYREYKKKYGMEKSVRILFKEYPIVHWPGGFEKLLEELETFEMIKPLVKQLPNLLQELITALEESEKNHD